MEDRLVEEKKALKAFFKDINVEVAVHDTVPELYAKVTSANLAVFSSKTHVCVLLLEMIERAQWKIEQREKKQAEVDRELDELFARKVALPVVAQQEDGEVLEPTWDTVRSQLESHSVFKRFLQNAASSAEGEAAARVRFQAFLARDRNADKLEPSKVLASSVCVVGSLCATVLARSFGYFLIFIFHVLLYDRLWIPPV